MKRILSQKKVGQLQDQYYNKNPVLLYGTIFIKSKMNTLQKITQKTTDRNCGYLVESQMQTSYEVSPDKLQLQNII